MTTPRRRKPAHATASTSPPTASHLGAGARPRDRCVGRPADLQRGGEHPDDRAGDPRRRCRAPRSSSSTTARPTARARIADELAAADIRIRVHHRREKQGLGRAYLDGFGVALAGGAEIVIQMDADWSHDPPTLPALIAPIVGGTADLVIGSRYTKGGGVVDWGLGRRIISRGGSIFARTVLRLGPRDLTGGFKAWRASTLAAIPFDGIHAGGYVFQIEMTFRASRSGARVAEVPITFRDRRVGQSKMSRRIVVEALVVVVTLRAEELLGRAAGRGRRPIAGVPKPPAGRRAASRRR